MVGVDLTSLNLPVIQAKLGLQTADTTAARDFNIRQALGAGYSHLQANYISEWAIQSTTYPAGRTTFSTTRVKENPFINDDISQIFVDMNVGLINSPKYWRAR